MAAGPEAPPASACQVPKARTSLAAYLPRVAERLASGLPVRIVALGSSSTAGAGASAPDRTYPARLAHYLHQWAGSVEVSVLNKGINGETDDQTVERIGSDVLAQNADLLIWQVGANTVLRDGDFALSEKSVRRGVEQAQAAGLDVVLMDLQYAPRMLAKDRTDAMLAQIAHVAADEHVGLFQRFAVMRDLVESKRMTVGQLIGPDGVHQSDAGYDCVARTLAAGIEDAIRPQQGRAD
ncbi:lysophospholipase L1-like esterase [Azospirillum agricola]|uniref:SGNH/GDSL hydrolase family protein n=1 Tax=Azospirillum agricola TaxID=1720247 RepID=UPI001AE59584|nr:SGNH/GDSL hydrolase family protein [Azospirillum agricola]MBP2231565.1 lysophospholipase L1-like esterase [Azospirillum agricola]